MKKTDYFKDLISDAIYLRNDIDSVTNDIVHARLNNDEEGNKKAIFRMEKVMADTLQFLSCLVERKDNIVDLGEVWHRYKDVKPCNMDDLCIFTIDGVPLADIHNMAGVERFLDYDIKNVIAARRMRWAYLYDLLPKGGE